MSRCTQEIEAIENIQKSYGLTISCSFRFGHTINFFTIMLVTYILNQLVFKYFSLDKQLNYKHMLLFSQPTLYHDNNKNNVSCRN